MLTKNFFNANMALLSKQTVANGLVLLDGTVENAAYYNSISSLYTLDRLYEVTKNEGSIGVYIGSGATPATMNDYKLEKMITSGFSVSNPSSVAVSAESDHISVTATYAITNSGSTALEINEIGLVGQYFTYSSTTKKVLLDRTVLESPITINPGQSKQITYTIRFNYPTEV